MNLKEYAQGNNLFRSYFKENKESLLELVKGQKPKALFIGCSDSRVIPDLMLQTNPGDLFVLRNVGNFVPPYKEDDDFHATASGIEYAVGVLEVQEIIICGHTHCGACKLLYEDIQDKDNSLIHTRKWLELGESAKKAAVLSLGTNSPQDALLRLTEKLSVINQIENILTYPKVKKRFENGDLHIHGWCYDIETGKIEYYNAETYEFLPLKELASH